MKLKRARHIAGRLSLPGDKSISHRVALIAALAKGTTHLSNFATSRDCASTIDCLSSVGVQIERSGNSYVIQGREQLRAPGEALDCGNSGSTMRILSGVLASQNFRSQLVGDSSLSSRPMRRIIEPLELMGARIDSHDGRPPLTINGVRDPRPISYKLPVASAQVKSAILFAALRARGITEVVETSPSRDHTERLFNGFGVPVHSLKNDAGFTSVTLEGPQRFEPRNLRIPGDPSSAAYFVAAAMLLAGSRLILEDISLNPTRIEFLSVLSSWGAEVRIVDSRSHLNEPVGTIHVEAGLHSAIHESDRIIGGARVPSLIDELPLLAVVGSQLPGGLRITDAGELRFKESDRLRATALNLRAMGVEVDENDDGLTIHGPVRLRGARIQSFGDHRIAMAFSIAALIADDESYVTDSDCVNISCPEFFQILNSVTAH